MPNLVCDTFDAQKSALRPERDLLYGLIDQHDIAALLVNVNTAQVLWASNATSALDKRITCNASLYDIPELLAVLQDTSQSNLPGSSMSQAIDTDHVVARCTLKPPAQVQSPAVNTAESAEDPICAGVNVAIRSVNRRGEYLLLQLDWEQDLDNYYQQYVADRERLFNTSRALTVNEMATTLAHELNQPIGTVVNLLHGCLDRLKRHNEAVDSEGGVQVELDVIDALDFAIRQSRFASQIIARVREFTEARQPSMEQLDVRALMQESVQLLDWVFSSEHISLSLQAGTDPLLVSCDRMLLQQVLINICRNAIEAMREIDHNKRHLNVLAHRSDDGVQIDIADTGPGMEQDVMEKMFKPFVSSKRDGMGVGLNICRSFVELHQGRLWVTRNNLQGCTVHIQLPELQIGEKRDQ